MNNKPLETIEDELKYKVELLSTLLNLVLNTIDFVLEHDNKMLRGSKKALQVEAKKINKRLKNI